MREFCGDDDAKFSQFFQALNEIVNVEVDRMIEVGTIRKKTAEYRVLVQRWTSSAIT